MRVKIVLSFVLMMFVTSIGFAAEVTSDKPKVVFVVTTQISEREQKKLNEESMIKVLTERNQMYRDKLNDIAKAKGYEDSVIKFAYTVAKTKKVKKDQRNFNSPINLDDIRKIANQHNADYVIDILAPLCWVKSSGFIVGQSVSITYTLIAKTYDANGNLIDNYRTDQTDSSTGITIGPIGGAGGRSAFKDAQIKCLDDLATNIKLPPASTHKETAILTNGQ